MFRRFVPKHARSGRSINAAPCVHKHAERPFEIVANRGATQKKIRRVDTFHAARDRSSLERAFRSLVGLQALTRAVNFALTTALARQLGPELIGLANVQLQLVAASALFFAKEGLRRACQRVYPGGDGPPLAHGVNLAWLAVPLTFVSGFAVGYSTRRGSSSNETVSADAYSDTVMLFCVAAIVEAAAEPAWLYAQANGLIPTRVTAEGGALLLRALATGLLVLRGSAGGGDGAALAFGWAQLLYAASYLFLLCLLLHWRTGGKIFGALTPRRALVDSTAPPAWLPSTHLTVTYQYLWQSVQKYLLTEGERLVLVGYADLHQQGVFALVSNLGSLVARLVLQPVEEVVFAHYSQLAASARLAKRRTIGLNALRRMHALLRAAAIFGGLFLAFGPPYSWLLLRLLYGTKWTTGTNAPTLLGAYCLHVMMMAINGIGEAYVNATATEAELTKLSRYMVLLAIVYLPAAALSLKFAGSVGLVLANALNMVARAAYAYTTLTAATNAAASAKTVLPRRWPHRYVMLALGASSTITLLVGAALGAPADRSPVRHALHVAVGGGCLLVVGACAWKFEPELLEAISTARSKGE